MSSPVAITEWVGEIPATVAASIYALPEPDRLRGAQAAHAKGHWIHADVILEADSRGRWRNRGVALETIRQCLDSLPGASVDVHVIVCGSPDESSALLGDLALDLAELPIARCSAAPAVLRLLAPQLQPNCEIWAEHWQNTDDSGVKTDGALTMLITPGTTNDADPRQLDLVRHLAVRGAVGVDGGVTRKLAQHAVGAGASYLVIGRALFTASS